jgi:hypothetical protein
MYIAMLKDGPKRVKKTFSMILERAFEMVWWRGRIWNYIKKDISSWSIFLLSKYWLPLLFVETLVSFFLFLSFFFFFSMLRLLRTWGFWWYLRTKSLLEKPLFIWHDMEWHGHDYGYTGGGCIFQNGVMHDNIGKPWLWRCGSCGYIDGGRIIQSGVMHANIFGWG